MIFYFIRLVYFLVSRVSAHCSKRRKSRVCVCVVCWYVLSFIFLLCISLFHNLQHKRTVHQYLISGRDRRMTDFKGGAMDGFRIRAMEKQLEQERKNRQAEMERIAEESRRPKVFPILHPLLLLSYYNITKQYIKKNYRIRWDEYYKYTKKIKSI